MRLNDPLRKHNLPLVYVSSVHDCFKINTMYADLLIPLLQNSYNSLNKLEKKLNIPGLLAKDKKRIYGTNHEFIRH